MDDVNGNCRDCIYCPYTDPGMCKKRKVIICYSDQGCSQLKREHDFEKDSFVKPYVKKRNPSYKIAPHCTIKPRVCYCFDDVGVKRCEIGEKNFTRLKVHDIGNSVITTSQGKYCIKGLKDSDLKRMV